MVAARLMPNLLDAMEPSGSPMKDRMEFRLGSEQRVCGQGDVVIIPGGTEHEAWFGKTPR